MSDLLSHLAIRATSPQATVQPSVPSLFEAPRTDAISPIGESDFLEETVDLYPEIGAPARAGLLHPIEQPSSAPTLAKTKVDSRIQPSVSIGEQLGSRTDGSPQIHSPLREDTPQRAIPTAAPPPPSLMNRAAIGAPDYSSALKVGTDLLSPASDLAQAARRSPKEANETSTARLPAQSEMSSPVKPNANAMAIPNSLADVVNKLRAGVLAKTSQSSPPAVAAPPAGARPRQTTSAQRGADADSTIEVSIGRIEIRTPGSQMSRPVPRPQTAAVMTLAQYLRLRNGGRR